MFTSITVPEEQDETRPTSSLPWIWFGFIFCFTFFVVEVLFVVMSLEEKGISAPLTLIWLAGWIYWLICVRRIHLILEELTRGRYPISPGEAALKHIIPFYNLVWIFKWPAEFSNYLNSRGRVKIVSGYLIGALLLFAFLARFLDGGFGLGLLFAVTIFIGAKLKGHVAAMKGVDPAKLPPLPDPEMFRRSPENS